LKRPRFLHDLFTERRIQIVSPSEDVAAAYLRKSTSHLASAILLNDNGHYEEAVSIAYYSMYHAVMALFFRTGIKCENHSAAIILAKEVYGIDTTPLSEAKRERIDSSTTWKALPPEKMLRNSFRVLNCSMLTCLTLSTISRMKKFPGTGRD
jgi:hypothetical protein